jgi:hypothetical protein
VDLKTPASLTVLRLVKRQDRVSLLVSTDASHWELVHSDRLELKDCYAGVLCRNNAATGAGVSEGRCHWRQASTSIPTLQISTKPDRDGTYKAPIEIALHSEAGDSKLRYTRDGSDPSADSPEYRKPIQVEDAGQHEIRFAVFSDGKTTDVVRAVVTVHEG